MKKCKKCKVLKKFDCFYLNIRMKNNRENICKNCKREYQKKYLRTEEGYINDLYHHIKQRSGTKELKFDKSQFKKWLKHQDNYNFLFQQWKESNFDKNLYPSVDRLDDYKRYEFSNMQLITWEENNKKGCKSRVEGINTKAAKGVCKIDPISGEILEIYPSIRFARRKNKYRSHSNISKVCKNKSGTAYGYTWRYKNTVDK